MSLENSRHGLGLFGLQRLELSLATSVLSIAIGEPAPRDADRAIEDGELLREPRGVSRFGQAFQVGGASGWQSTDNWRVNVSTSSVTGVGERPASEGSIREQTAARFDWRSLRLYLKGIEHAQLAVAGSIATPNGPLRIGENHLADDPRRSEEQMPHDRSTNPNEIQVLITTPFR